MLTTASLVVSTRILSISYQSTPDGLSVGSLAVWGDWSAHAAYASSFSDGDNRHLDLPIASGHGFRYHFLADFFGSTFTVAGATVPQGLAISAWLLAAALPPLMWFVVIHLTRSRLAAGITVLLFTLSGGIGLWYFAADVERDGWSIVTALPRTYARIPDQELWVDNTISASLYAQRSTSMGLVVGFAALLVVLVARPSRARAGFASAGVLIGMLGIAHAHMLLTALALSLLAFALDRDRVWLWFVVPAATIGLPLSVLILPETSSIRWLIGWMAPGADQAWPWFWFRNVGLFLPLFASLALLGGGPQRLRRLTAPLWLWFVVPNLIAFHPSEWNNTKYFLFWQFAGCLVIGGWMADVLTSKRRSGAMDRALGFVAVVVALLLVSAGSLDTVRAMQRSSAIPWVSNDDLAAAEWLRKHSDPDATIVYGMTNTSAVAALSGRRSVSGYAGWTYDLGLGDWIERWDASRSVLAGTADADTAIDRYGVDFVVIGPAERAEFAASDSYWEAHGDLAFESPTVRIYAVQSR